jgi:hypothetical protein
VIPVIRTSCSVGLGWGVFSNPVSEPIQNDRELDESEVGRSELVIAGRDSAEVFDAAEEVFHSVTAPMIASVEPVGPRSPSLGSDVGSNISNAKRRVESVRIEAAIGDRMLVSEDWQQRKDRLEVVLLTRGQAEPNRSTQRIDHGGKLRVDSEFCPANRLERLPTRPVGSVLVKLDVRRGEVLGGATLQGCQPRRHKGTTFGPGTSFPMQRFGAAL